MGYEKYVEEAKRLGAGHAVEFTKKDIKYDSRTILKCLFGCEDYGKLHTCPNQRSLLSVFEYRKILKRYKGGIIIGHSRKKESQDISYEIERQCFLDGHYFAFSLSDCGLCQTCGLATAQPCRQPKKARPAFHSVGIDVFKTVRKLGLPIEVLRSQNDAQNWYSAVFID